MTKLPATPYFKDLTTDELRSELRSWQNLSYTWGQMACSASPASRTGQRIAQGWGRCERNVDLIINILHKRGRDMGNDKGSDFQIPYRVPVTVAGAAKLDISPPLTTCAWCRVERNGEPGHLCAPCATVLALFGTTAGPCVRCSKGTVRYGEAGRAYCAPCRAATNGK